MVLTSNKLPHYQRWLKKKFEAIEALYYSRVDELTQTIGDLDLPGVQQEDFTITQFSFIDQWENGLISSERVYEIMEMMNIEQAAKSKITKRLQNYMFKYGVLSEHIKPVVAELNDECVELMMQYLDMMKRFFQKMSEVDDEQLPISWVQQFFKKDKGVEIVTEEMSLNQTIRHIGAFLHETSSQRFHLTDQVIVFDEEVGHEDRTIHWIFAPRTYIELLRVLFNVKEVLGKEEIEFLKNLIKEIE